ncbi:glutamate--cysteine ligase [candidate division KSB1 bacterium]|nr:glutamate--cysteine ligase [candidate division KSB1 bacterium]
MSIVFHGSPEPTIGVECELALVDPKSWRMVNAAPAILEHFPDSHYAKPELLETIIEVISKPCRTVQEVRADMLPKIKEVQRVAEKIGYTTTFVGTHPTATWGEQRITKNERYQEFVHRMQWPVRRAMIMGLHVHVGVASGEKAIAFLNAITTFLPHLLALSCASPYFAGEDTGLASCRVKIFEVMPTAGLPHRMLNWAEFQRFMRTLITAGAIKSIREIWWDVRPHPGFGTIEIRVCDGTPDFEDVLAITAMIQALVVWLDHLYDLGDELPIHKYWSIKENKWRAARYGLDGDVIYDDHGQTRPFRDDIRELLATLRPFAATQDSTGELERIELMLNRDGSYSRQRKAFEKSGSLEGVVESLVAEWQSSVQ